MLLSRLGAEHATQITEISMEQYPLLLSLTIENGVYVLNQVADDPDDSVSLEFIYPKLISIRENFHRPTQTPLMLIAEGMIASSVDSRPLSEMANEQLHSFDEEYKKVATHFATNIFEIKGIHRLVSKEWLDNFERPPQTSRKSSYPPPPEEKILYHGCLPSACRKIVTQGFSSDLISIHGRNRKNNFRQRSPAKHFSFLQVTGMAMVSTLPRHPNIFCPMHCRTYTVKIMVSEQYWCVL